MPEIRPTLDLDLVWTAGHLPRKPIDADLFRLLEAIKRSGKLSVATAEVGLHYRQAWGLITTWSERMGQPLVAKARGRGTRLTALGERLLWIRERINARLAPHLESAASEVEQQLGEILDETHPALCVYASHDLVLAELRDLLRTGSGPKLDVRFVGSLESVVALCKSQCEIAGFHLPEGSLGREVFPKYEPWLKPRVQRLIHFVRRAQGLIVAPGNPLGIGSLADVARTKARFINRQRGSGTHLALDKMLADSGIDKGDISGYYTEEFTHLAVAAAIAGARRRPERHRGAEDRELSQDRRRFPRLRGLRRRFDRHPRRSDVAITRSCPRSRDALGKDGRDTKMSGAEYHSR